MLSSRTFGSAPNRLCHNAWLSNTTLVPAGDLLLRQEAASQGRLNTEKTKKTGGYGGGGNLFRLAALRQDELRGSDRSDVRERPSLPPPLEEVAHRDIGLLQQIDPG